MTELLSAQQVADRLGVAERTVRRWIERGNLTPERHGHAFAIDLAEAERVFSGTVAGRAAKRISAATSARDDEIEAVKQELAVFRGRYAEVKERADRLETELALERRRVAMLEARLDPAALRVA